MKKLSLSFLLVFLLNCCKNSANTNNSSNNDSLINNNVKNKIVVIDSVPLSIKKINQIEIILSKAISISNEIYKSLLKQNYTEPNKFIHPDAFEESTPDDFTASYKNAQVKMGKLAYVKLIDQGAKTHTSGENGVGDYCELIFDAQYKDGNLREKFIFFRRDSTQELKLLGYQYHQIVDEITLTEKLRLK